MTQNLSDKRFTIFSILLTIVFFSIVIPFNKFGFGIDASWAQAIVMALSNNERFGTEFVFNYGPIGFLNTGVLPSNISPWIFTLYYSFLLINFLFIFNDFEKKIGFWPMVFVALSLILPTGLFVDATFSLFLIIIYWQNKYIAELKPLWLIFCTISIAILIPLKLNLSLIALALLTLTYVYSILLLDLKRSFYYISLSLIIGILLESIIAKIFNFDILASLISSGDIINAYQDAMSAVMISKNEIILYFGLVFWSGFGLFTIFLSKKLFNLKVINLLFTTSLAWFLQYKQAFTAMADINIGGFFSYLPALVVIISIFYTFNSQKKLRIYVAHILILTFLGNVYIRLKVNNFEFKTAVKSFTPQASKSKLPFYKYILSIPLRNNPMLYFKKLNNFKYADYYQNLDETTYLPASFLTKIGGSTIDVLPWDVSYIFYNKLNYKHRPIIQSYQANSETLMNKNWDFFSSAERPKYVLSKLGFFREQNPFWMDGGVQITLFKDYKLVDSCRINNEPLYLFEVKREKLNRTKFKEIQIANSDLDQKINLPETNDNLWLKADIKYSLLGKVAKMFYQPPYLRCQIVTESKKQYNFRIPPSILKGGVWVNKLIIDNSQYFKLHSTGSEIEKIRSIRFYCNTPSGFNQKFDYSISEF